MLNATRRVSYYVDIMTNIDLRSGKLIKIGQIDEEMGDMSSILRRTYLSELTYDTIIRKIVKVIGRINCIR